MFRLGLIINELKEEELQFSNATTRQRHDHWEKENEIFTSILEKALGIKYRQDKAEFLLYQLRRKMYPHGSNISVYFDSFCQMKDYSTLSGDSRKSRSQIFKAFYELGQ